MPRRLDLLLAALLWIGALVELSLRGAEMPALHAVVVTTAALAVAVRRRSVWAALALSFGGFLTLGLLRQEVETTAQVLAMLAVLFTVGDALPRRQAVAGLLGFVGTLVLQNTVLTGQNTVWDTLWLIFVLVLPPWVLGRLIRERRARIAALERLHADLDAERERICALAAEAERARIAREMHDALSHSVGVMSLQAGAGERLAATGDLEGARAAAQSIAAAGRTALAELDELFGTAAEELPRDLESLLDGVRAAGLHVDLRRHGNGAALPPDVELAVHRIVQEALTNAVKHAAAQRVSVELTAGRGQVEVRVEDDGEWHGRGGGGGRGLIGMRERARVYGGELEAGPRPDGGFHVRARLSWT